MEAEEFIERLACGEDMFRALVCCLDEDHARWRPEPGKWSILEVINHLHDEEREDFRQRLDLTLNRPGAAWPSIDPGTWVRERAYNDRNFKNSIENFVSERRKSVAWLRSLESPDWKSSHEHPVFGPIGAGDILCAWLAHDYFHARQISNILIQNAAFLSAPFTTRYAFG